MASCVGQPPAPPSADATGSVGDGGNTTTALPADTTTTEDSGDPVASGTGAGTGEDTSADSTTTSDPLDCTMQNGGCDPNATCHDRSGRVECACNPGYMGDGTSCSVDAALPTLRMEFPCMGDPCGATSCTSGTNAGVAADLFTGDPAVTYQVTLRIRGVVEEKEYIGGVNDGLWNEGGEPNGDPWNVYTLDISDPPQAYYLNDGVPQADHCEGLDYQQTLMITGGSAVQITMTDTNTCITRNQDESGVPIVIPGIPPAPDSFNGQFLQVDAVDIVPVP